MTEEIEKEDLQTISGNTDFDSIICYKSVAARKAGIRLEADIKIPVDLDFNFMDLTILLGNLLDNAITATQAVAMDDRDPGDNEIKTEYFMD